MPSLFDFGHSRGGLIREGGLFTKLDDKSIHDSGISIHPIFCGLNMQC